jgi:hypothetical protein
MAHPFFDPLTKCFGSLLDQYGFKATSQQYETEGFGSGLVRLESERYYLDFQVEGMGPELAVYAGRTGQLATDLAWIFAYLTHSVNPSPSGAAAWLYYYPHMSLKLWGEASINWQLARLADILQSMWPAIFIFLDMEGPHSKDFQAFQERAKRAAAEHAADGYWLAGDQLEMRAPLNFTAAAEKSFAFLNAYGFKIVHSDPIYVRFETTALIGQASNYVNIFHRLHSYQLGLHTGRVQNDASFEMNFDMDELAAWSNIPYTPAIVKTAAELPQALNRMARLFRRCAAPALANDQRLFEALQGRRIDAARRASRAWAERNRFHLA